MREEVHLKGGRLCPEILAHLGVRATGERATQQEPIELEKKKYKMSIAQSRVFSLNDGSKGGGETRRKEGGA